MHETKGVYAWINFGPVSLEPAELMKFAFVLLLGAISREISKELSHVGADSVPPFLLAMVPLVLILRQPDLGMAMLFLPVLFVMLFVAGAKIKHSWRS